MPASLDNSGLVHTALQSKGDIAKLSDAMRKLHGRRTQQACILVRRSGRMREARFLDKAMLEKAVMAIHPSIGILATGDMGHALGARLRTDNATVVTCLAGRSERSRLLAGKAGFEIAADDDALLSCIDIFLSVVPPGAALEMAERISTVAQRTGRRPLYVDCNAKSPQTARRVADVVEAARMSCVDAAIVGPPPKPDQGPGPRLYACGPDISRFEALREYGLDVRPLGTEIGRASALKMSYAALTKGLAALGCELLLAAELAGVREALAEEMRDTQPMILNWLATQLPTMPHKAYRWVAEMEEAGRYFAGHQLPAATMEGPAALYTWITGTTLGQETPENRQRGQTLDAVIRELAAVRRL